MGKSKKEKKEKWCRSFRSFRQVRTAGQQQLGVVVNGCLVRQVGLGTAWQLRVGESSDGDKANR